MRLFLVEGDHSCEFQTECIPQNGRPSAIMRAFLLVIANQVTIFKIDESEGEKEKVTPSCKT